MAPRLLDGAVMRITDVLYVAMTLCASGCFATDAPSAHEGQAVGGGTDPIDPPPSGLFANVNTDKVLQLGWTCGSNQASETRVLRSVGRDGPQEQIWSLPVCPEGQVRYVTSGVQPATEYCFVVIASNVNYAEASDPLCVTSDYDLVPPTLPRVTTTRRTQTQLTWELEDRANNESYVVFEYRKPGDEIWHSAVFDRRVRAHRATGQIDVVTSIPLQPNTTYEYRTRIGHDFLPLEAASEISSVSTLPPPPAPPFPGCFPGPIPTC